MLYYSFVLCLVFLDAFFFLLRKVFLDALLIGFLSLFSKVENKLVAINDVPFHLLLYLWPALMCMMCRWHFSAHN